MYKIENLQALITAYHVTIVMKKIANASRNRIVLRFSLRSSFCFLATSLLKKKKKNHVKFPCQFTGENNHRKQNDDHKLTSCSSVLLLVD